MRCASSAEAALISIAHPGSSNAGVGLSDTLAGRDSCLVHSLNLFSLAANSGNFHERTISRKSFSPLRNGHLWVRNCPQRFFVSQQFGDSF